MTLECWYDLQRDLHWFAQSDPSTSRRSSVSHFCSSRLARMPPKNFVLLQLMVWRVSICFLDGFSTVEDQLAGRGVRTGEHRSRSGQWGDVPSRFSTARRHVEKADPCPGRLRSSRRGARLSIGRSTDATTSGERRWHSGTRLDRGRESGASEERRETTATAAGEIDRPNAGRREKQRTEEDPEAPERDRTVGKAFSRGPDESRQRSADETQTQRGTRRETRPVEQRIKIGVSISLF